MTQGRFLRQHRGGFTLVELLVAMVVLTLLLVIVLQITSQTSVWAKSGTQKMNASREAQTALGALENDLTTLFNDNLTGVIAGRVTAGVNSNSAIAFLCRARPRRDVTNSRLTALFFNIRSNPDPELGIGNQGIPMLCRDYGAVPWGLGTGAPLSQAPRVALSQAAQINALPNTKLTAQVVSRGVFRMEIVYVLADGTITPRPPARTPAQNISPSIPTGMTDLDLTKVKAIIVAVISLDDQSRKLILNRSATALSDYAAAFPPVTTDNQTPADLWAKVQVPDSLAPASVRSATCIIQKTINLY